MSTQSLSRVLLCFAQASLRSSLLAACLVPALSAQELLAIKAGKLIPINGSPAENVTVLCENGRIVEIGKDVQIPWNATVVDASDKVVAPCWVIAHTSGGLDRENENMPVTPFVSVNDAIDPIAEYFEQALRDGIGALHILPGNNCLVGGQGAVIRPYGKTIEEMTIKSRSGLKISYWSAGGSRTGQVGKVRRVFEELTDYLKERDRKKKETEEEKALPSADPKKEQEEELDSQKKPLVELLEGKWTAFVAVPTAAEVPEAIRLIQKYKLNAVLVLGPTCYKAVDQIKESGLPVVLDPAMEFYEVDPDTEEEKLICPARVFDAAGVSFALSHSTGAAPRMIMGPTSPASPAAQYPWWQAAVAVRNGVSRETALRAFTTVPAKILGLEQRVGSIEVGKDANLQVLTGEPMAATTWVDKVVLDGKLVYDRQKDKRLEKLLARPAKTEKTEGK